MSDLLFKVQTAREKATAQFIKDMVAHEMAMVIKSAFPKMLAIAIDKQKTEGFSVSGHLTQMTQNLFQPQMARLVIGQSKNEDLIRWMGGPKMMDLARGIMESKDQSERYARVVGHFEKFQDMVNEFTLSEHAKLPDKERERRGRVARQFANIIPSAIDRAQTMYNRENCGFNPDTLVLQGGGAKGISYGGVADVFYRTGTMDGIKHVAGTSAGALMGLLIAMGLPNEDIHDIVKTGQFAQFFSESTSTFKLMAKPGLMWDRFRNKVNPVDRPYLEGFNLSEFAEDCMLPQLAAMTGVRVSVISEMSDVQMSQFLARPDLDINKAYENAMSAYDLKLREAGRDSERGLLKFSAMLDHSQAWQACAHAIRSQRSDDHPESDLIESYLGDLIEMSVGRHLKQHPESKWAEKLSNQESRRKLDFTTLKALAEESGYKSFKEFGVAITRNHMMTLGWFPRAYRNTVSTIKYMFTGKQPEDKGYGPQDVNTNFQPVFVRAGDEYIDMPIKKAVRTSMNLPVLFDAIKHEGGRYIDGGINSNYPYRMFLDKHGDDISLAEEKTAGFMLSTVDSDMENYAIDEMAKTARKALAVELEKYPSSFKETLAEKSLEVSIFLHNIGINMIRLKPKLVVTDLKNALLDPVKKAGGAMVDRIMDRNNVSLPSEQILENTGVINTGMVNTADFHLNEEQKEVLMNAGRRSALSLLSGHADRHLRFSKDRLVSLINIENELLKKEGETPTLVLPQLAMNDPYQLMLALKESMGKDINVTDVLGGRVPDLVSKVETMDGIKGTILDDEKHYGDDLRFG
jgi:hypothetical protein